MKPKPLRKNASVRILAPTSAGQVLDRITILRIKARKLFGTGNHRSVNVELHELIRVWNEHVVANKESSELEMDLNEINQRLWEVEDKLREHEKSADFGSAFIETARSVYKLNDLRNKLKRQVDALVGSDFTEHKIYSS